jgi:hypothetical protein
MDASEVAQLVEVCRGKVRIYNQREVEFLQTVGGARTPTVAQARWLRDLAAREELNFAKINSAALAVLHAICRRWLPDGCLYGKEWVARNPTRADGKPGSFRINVNSGKWADFAQPDARGGDPISLAAYLFHDGDQVAAATDVKRMVGL